MLKIAKYAIVTNILLGALFIYFNFVIWDAVNTEYPTVIASHWSPLGIIAPHYVILNDNSIAMVQTFYSYFNYPFWIFFVLMAINLYFVIKLAKTKASNP